ncbi:flagellar hook-basal body complex protein FliE [Paenibacillus marinisediminis]
MIHNTMLVAQPTQTSTTASVKSPSQTPAEVTKAFSSHLQDALQQVDTQEQQVNAMTEQFMRGEVDVDQLMIASQRALLNLQLTVTIRNKVVEAYQEIMRMQM